MNRIIKWLLIGGYVWVLGEGMLGPLYAVFAERIGGSVLDIAWAWGLYLIVGGLLSILIGRLSDRVLDKKWTMIAGYALNAAATFGYLSVSTPAQLLVVQCLLGVALALGNPTWESLYAMHADKKKEGTEWGLWDGGARAILGVGVFIGGLIVTYAGFRALFITMGSIQVLATIAQAPVLFLHQERKK